MPWPLRWIAAAVVLGFCGAVGLWAFEFGKSIAGVDSGDKEELVALRLDVAKLRDERDKAQSVYNTSASLITTERAAQERLAAQVKQLEGENRALRDDLGFFEKLLPASGSGSVAIRGLQAEVLAAGQLKWQVLVMQALKNAPEFRGQLQLSVAGTINGKPWQMDLPEGPEPLQFRQYRRIEGVVDLPPGAVVQNVSARVVEGTATRAAQTVKL